MAEIIPIIVSNKDELAQALNLERTAIIITDQEICAAVRKKLPKTHIRSRGTKVGKTASAALGVGSFAVGLLGPAVLVPAAVIGTISGVLGLLGSTMVGLCSTNLYKYQAELSIDRTRILLIKTKGKNAVQKGDTVRGFAGYCA